MYSLTARHFKYKTSFYGTYFSIVIFLEENWILAEETKYHKSEKKNAGYFACRTCGPYSTNEALFDINTLLRSTGRSQTSDMVVEERGG